MHVGRSNQANNCCTSCTSLGSFVYSPALMLAVTQCCTAKSSMPQIGHAVLKAKLNQQQNSVPHLNFALAFAVCVVSTVECNCIRSMVCPDQYVKVLHWVCLATFAVSYAVLLVYIGPAQGLCSC